MMQQQYDGITTWWQENTNIMKCLQDNSIIWWTKIWWLDDKMIGQYEGMMIWWLIEMMIWWIKISFLLMRVADYELIPCNTLVQQLIACPLNNLTAIRMIDDVSDFNFGQVTLFLPPLVSGSASGVWAGFWAFCQIWYPWTVIFKRHQNQLWDCFGPRLASSRVSQGSHTLNWISLLQAQFSIWQLYTGFDFFQC